MQIHDDTGQPISDGQGGFLSDGVPVTLVYDGRTALFFVAELDTYRFGDPAGTLQPLRVSDLGYRTRASDVGGVVAYPGLLDQAFEIDRKVSLDPAQASSRSDGGLRITNLGGIFDTFALPRNIDARQIRVLVGQKSYDPTRGIYLDPPYASLRPFFVGLAASWLVSEDVVTVPVKDTSYWTARAAQTRTYGGTGGLDGGTALAGKPLPMTRGGTSANPVLQVSPVQVDAVAQVWQWTDGPGTIVQLYEGGAAVFEYAGDVADFDVPALYGASPPPGTYRTWNAKGLFRLGSNPVGAITADVTGDFPTAGAASTPVRIAFLLLTETLGVPTALVDTLAFDEIDARFRYAAGFYIADTTQGVSLVQGLVASVGGRLSSSRSGQLAPFVLSPSLYGATPATTLSPGNTSAVTPLALPSTLDPPPYRFQVAWGHLYTTQTSGLLGAVSNDPAHKQYLATADRYAVWTDPAISAAWVRPNDPAPIGTFLLNGDDAQAVAEAAGELWRDRPGYFSVEVPLDVAAGLDIGSVVRLTWPLSQLTTGALGQIVGEQIRSGEGTTTLQVLIARGIGDFNPAEFGGQFSGASA